MRVGQAADIDLDRLDAQVASIVRYLAHRQAPDGGFPTLRRFTGPVEPYVTPTEFPEWHHFGACPFSTANIVYHLDRLDVPGTREIRQKGRGFLHRGLENGVARYVPAIGTPAGFPTDVDDTCLAVAALGGDAVFRDWNREMVLANRDGNGNLYTWLVPRARHLMRPRNFVWLLRDARTWYREMRRWGRSAAEIRRVLREYLSSAEPAITANVLLCLGVTRRTRRFLRVLIQRVSDDDVPLQYYSNILATYFHVARLHLAGVKQAAVLAPKIAAYVHERQSAAGEVEDPFDTALAALTLMYFDRWSDAALHRAVQYVAAHPMHSDGWQPFHYCNDRDGVFVDGAAELTAAFYLEVLYRYRRWLSAQDGRP